VVIIVMGVAASGKTTVGGRLASRLGWAFHDADDRHPAANVEKMARGEPLTDADRAPWLDALRRVIDEALARGEHAVLACSALRRSYRDRLRPAPSTERTGPSPVRFVYLRASPDLVAARAAARPGHFMPAALVPSQFAALEEPDDALVVDAAEPPDALVDRIVAALSPEPPGPGRT
jgi:gluconokinase